ncbi:MAG TPA: ABC transporter permease subunit, partial [Clostridia bacterium]|nr:ABC transporter permease subunit [Clostridia bacterium]
MQRDRAGMGWIAAQRRAIRSDFRRYRMVYFMLIPVVAFYLLFHYVPLMGAAIAFKDFSAKTGIWGSRWVGFKHFGSFFSSLYFSRTLRNTLLISLYELIFGFPVPIILALLLNEVRGRAFKRIVQTVSYLPHFISVVVVCGMIRDFFSTGGLVNGILVALGGRSHQFLNDPGAFRTLLVGSNIWQSFGWNSIIYLAALTSIDPQLYEAATIDG